MVAQGDDNVFVRVQTCSVPVVFTAPFILLSPKFLRGII